MSVGSDLQPRPSRHQADGVEQRQVLGVQEELCGHQVGRVTGRGVGKQQVTAIQRGDGDCAVRCQSCGEDGELFYLDRASHRFPCMRTKPAQRVKKSIYENNEIGLKII